MTRTVFAIIGFLLFLIGFLALVLGFIGLGLYPVSLLDKAMSPLASFLIKLGMVLVGFIMFYMSRISREESM